MAISRRKFLQYCGVSAAAIGLDPFELGLLQNAVAKPDGPVVVWLQGSSCTGCSVSFLNRISNVAPYTTADVLTDHINLVFHPTLMSTSGEPAVAALHEAYHRGNYILVLEGGVPLAFDGFACIVYSYNGREVTMKEAVQQYAQRASHVVCAGTCASYGGIPASASNPTGVVGISELLGTPTINLPGCPTNPNWVVWAVVQLILGNAVPLDSVGRPSALYEDHGFIHQSCPRNLGGTNEVDNFGQDGQCLIRLGCRGPYTKARCRNCWNGMEGQGHWCIGVNAPCHGCVEPTFPGPESFYQPYQPGI
jgi:hydrogenase small subunit